MAWARAAFRDLTEDRASARNCCILVGVLFLRGPWDFFARPVRVIVIKGKGLDEERRGLDTWKGIVLDMDLSGECC